MNRMESIKQLYRNVLGRNADPAGLRHYMHSGSSLSDIQLHLSQSQEFKDKFKITKYPTEALDNTIPIFIINLPRRIDRKQQISQRLDLMKINNYAFVEAVDGSTLQNETSSEYYNKEKAINIKRNLLPNEIACSLSHLKIMQQMVNNNIKHAIIMEDDCIPTAYLHEFLKHFDPLKNNLDLLFLGYWSSNQWRNGKPKLKTDVPVICRELLSVVYLKHAHLQVGDVGIHKAHYPSLTLDYVSGSHCVMYSLEMAKRILQINYPVFTEADNVWNFLPESDLQFAYPLCSFTEFFDSDLDSTRPSSDQHIELFSDSFKKRVSHPDFGT